MGNVKIGDWLSEAWNIVSQDLVTHILLALIVGLGSGITGGILSGPLMGGYLWIIFKKMKDPSYVPQVGDVSKGFENFVQLLLVPASSPASAPSPASSASSSPVRWLCSRCRWWLIGTWTSGRRSWRASTRPSRT
ncbi:MAG: hypothetical protein GX131_09165 [candidate division WS1 bacterium]|nr:hypothetical protein [candidate division WS1 bacterium]